MILKNNIIQLSNYEISISIGDYSSEDIIYLNEKEREIWVSKKKILRNGKNWFVGRVAAKRAIANCLGTNVEEVSSSCIENNSEGVPYFIDIKNRNIVLTISHCKEIGFSCCTLDSLGIGCDIEIVKKRHSDFTTYYLSTFEEELWNKENSDEDLETIQTIAWSCKEACYKSLCSIGESVESLYDIYIYPLSDSIRNFKFNFKGREGIGCWDKYGEFITSIAILARL